MRQLLFIICFSLGVSLMVLSGYVPRSVSAGGTPEDAVGAAEARRSGGTAAFRPRSNAWMYHPDASGTDDTGSATADPSEPPPAGAESDAPSGAGPEAAPEPVDLATALANVIAPAAAPGETEPPADEQERERSERRRHGTDDAGAGDAGEAPADSASDATPVADAGADRAVWAGSGGVLLDGSKSRGEGLTYAWRQTAGPTWLEIEDPSEPVTWAGGLTGEQGLSWAPATYEFELVVHDNAGRQAAQTVRVAAQAAPELTIDPPAEPRFEERDGYIYGVFESWATNHQTDQFTFTISSAQRLKFTGLGGDPYELTGRKTGGVCIYHVTLGLVPGQATSWAELLVETSEKVPGIVRLGVSWYAPAADGTAEQQDSR